MSNIALGVLGLLGCQCLALFLFRRHLFSVGIRLDTMVRIVGLLLLGVAIGIVGLFTMSALFSLSAPFPLSALGGGAFKQGFWAINIIDLDRFRVPIVGAIALLTAWVGGSVAKREGRVPTFELLISELLLLEIAALLLVNNSTLLTLTSAPVRLLLSLPPVLVLTGYFGASVGFLLWGGNLKLSFEGLIARRFLLSKADGVLSTVTTISVVGVTLGVWLVIVALGILTGFEEDLQKKIMGAHAHIAIQSPGNRPFQITEAQLMSLRQKPYVTGSTALVRGNAAVASSSNYAGTVVFGIDPATSANVLKLLTPLYQGTLQPLLAEVTEQKEPTAVRDPVDNPFAIAPPQPLPHIILGSELQRTLNVHVGERVTLISPLIEDVTPLGMKPRSRPFIIAGIFKSDMYEFDSRYAYVSLPAARHFFALGKEDISVIQVSVKNPNEAAAMGQLLLKDLSPNLAALDWQQRNATLFSALKLERVVAFIVLAFIILVASFAIVNTLSMSVIAKRKEIAILKTMGVRDVSVMKVFLTQGIAVGGVGTVLGAFFALLTVLALKQFGFWIPGEVYYIDALPVSVDVGDILLVVCVALLIVWDFAVYPALTGAALAPVEGLRDG